MLRLFLRSTFRHQQQSGKIFKPISNPLLQSNERHFGRGSIRAAHSKPTSHSFDNGAVDVHVVPILEDNYSYLIVDKATNEAAAVDPADYSTVMKTIEHYKCDLKSLLITHHHWDHTQGNVDFVKKFPHLEVYGLDVRIEALTHTVQNKDRLKVGETDVDVLFTPCHTSGHVSYFFPKSKILFPGDTLFVSGCGRFFEGSAEDMCHFLKLLSKMDSQTTFFPGHEYTVNNLKFANSIEPNNAAILKKLNQAMEQRSQKLPTIPATLKDEYEYNPFLRAHLESMQKNLKVETEEQAVAELRRRKDNF